MYHNGMFYIINNDNDYEDMVEGLKNRRKELSSLKSKFWKNDSIKREIEFIEKNIEGSEKACDKYLKRKRTTSYCF
ncbi:hypothetical protein P7H42_10035 [Vagococcus lutrae]|uniref:hypothetical protein n=1 Tax=Vagococcus lutrae TaxID=81947 RepID=UPI0028912B53|nr:hypothetical protein [Vagococcus lutrae]MDT2820071.1 hypothetical protein [Vagococcus lutrae]MDT2845008.1 hypothetical protein [Vagococcus lutrae]